MLSHLFPLRRQRAADGDTTAQPPAKKHKTSEDESQEQQQRVFEEPFLLHKIASYLKADDKWKLGATCKEFYVFFAVQAEKELDATDASVPGAAFKDRVILKSLVALELKGERGLSRLPDTPTMLESILNWARRLFGAGRQPPSSLLTQLPHRYWLEFSYTIPLREISGLPIGPSCPSFSMGDPQQQRLTCLAPRGALVTVNPVTGVLAGLLLYTREAQNHLQWYSFITDQLWYCKPGNSNGEGDKGLLVLQHDRFEPFEKCSVLDLARNNQDIGRPVPGIDQRRIELSQAFRSDFESLGDMTVSSEHALIFFVANDRQGRIGLESYNARTGQHVASTRRQVGSPTPALRPHTTVTFSHDKLVVVYSTEEEDHGPATDYGFGIYVFRCHDLSFCHYVPMFQDSPVYVNGKSTEDWFIYEEPHSNITTAVQITGGTVRHVSEIELGASPTILLVTAVSVYAYDPDKREGDIEIVQFDIFTGNKIRTLETGIPWMVPDEDRTRRMVADAHVVQNQVVILITSVGSHINSIVTFALPTKVATALH